MKTKTILQIFIIVAMLQILLLLSIIVRKENILRTGTRIKIKVQPVDPYDAFRGRYIALDVSYRISKSEKNEYHRGQKVYALLEVDNTGFASIKGVAPKKPHSQLYFKTFVKGNDGRLALPYDRYYIEDSKALEVEKAYKRSRESSSAYISVKVKYGSAVLEEVYLKNIPVLEFYDQENKNNGQLTVDN